MTRIAEVVKDIQFQYGQCDTIVPGDMSIQDVFNQVVAEGLESVGVRTDWSDTPVLIDRKQILDALLIEIEGMQTALNEMQHQINNVSAEQVDSPKIQGPPLSSPGTLEKFEQAIKAMTEGLIILDADGKAELANVSARALLGLDSQASMEAVGSLLDQLGFRSLMTMSVHSSGQHSGQFRIKAGSSRLLETRWSQLQNDWGRHIGWVITMRDITSEVAAENTKSEFIAAISHELRTPLTSIQNSVSNILAGVTGRINDKTHTYLEVMQEDCHRFADLINDLLDIAKLEAGNLPVTQRVMSLESLADNTTQEFAPLAAKSNITLTCQVEPDICPVFADVKRIQQVMTNLLRNAIHHTPRGGKVTVSVHDRGSDIVTEVADTGPGISMDMQRQLFTKFYQIARQAGPGSKGNGLGLAICKGIIAVHGGSIWVESEQDKGSRFFFSLPKIDPKGILQRHIDMITSSSRISKTRLGLLLLTFEMSQKSDIPLRHAAGKIIADLLGKSRFFLGGELDLALQTSEHEMVWIVNDFGRQTVESVQQKIEMNLLNFIKKHFTGVPIVPMLGKSLWPHDGTDKSGLETAARNTLAPVIAG